MGEDELFARRTAQKCQNIAKSLGDSQSDGRTLSGKEMTVIVNALLNAGNQLELFVREKWGAGVPFDTEPIS